MYCVLFILFSSFLHFSWSHVRDVWAEPVHHETGSKPLPDHEDHKREIQVLQEDENSITAWTGRQWSMSGFCQCWSLREWCWRWAEMMKWYADFQVLMHWRWEAMWATWTCIIITQDQLILMPISCRNVLIHLTWLLHEQRVSNVKYHGNMTVTNIRPIYKPKLLQSVTIKKSSMLQ